MAKKNANKNTAPEDLTKPGHHYGPTEDGGYGYDLLDDGSYELAPILLGEMEDITAQTCAIHRLMNSVQDHAQEQLIKLEKRRISWFKRACATVHRSADMNLAQYDYTINKLSFKDRPTPATNKQLEERIELDKAGAGKRQE